MAVEAAEKVAVGANRASPSASSGGVYRLRPVVLRLLAPVQARFESWRERFAGASRAVRGASGGHLLLVPTEGNAAAGVFPVKPGLSLRWVKTKRAMDIVLAGAMILLLSPVMLIVAAFVASSGRPILFRQTRIGRDGQPFKLVKFRTMVPDAEARLRQVLQSDPVLQEEWNLTQKLQNDPRITRSGGFLRRSSLDELPQLFNVLAGDMSLVGPRPVIPDELARYGASAPWYTAVKPGVTGLWQVSGRNDTCYVRRVSLDVHYVRSQKLWLDLFILVKTVYVVLLGKGAH